MEWKTLAGMSSVGRCEARRNEARDRLPNCCAALAPSARLGAFLAVASLQAHRPLVSHGRVMQGTSKDSNSSSEGGGGAVLQVAIYALSETSGRARVRVGRGCDTSSGNKETAPVSEPPNLMLIHKIDVCQSPVDFLCSQKDTDARAITAEKVSWAGPSVIALQTAKRNLFILQSGLSVDHLDSDSDDEGEVTSADAVLRCYDHVHDFSTVYMSGAAPAPMHAITATPTSTTISSAVVCCRPQGLTIATVRRRTQAESTEEGNEIQNSTGISFPLVVEEYIWKALQFQHVATLPTFDVALPGRTALIFCGTSANSCIGLYSWAVGDSSVPTCMRSVMMGPLNWLYGISPALQSPTSLDATSSCGFVICGAFATGNASNEEVRGSEDSSDLMVLRGIDGQPLSLATPSARHPAETKRGEWSMSRVLNDAYLAPEMSQSSSKATTSTTASVAVPSFLKIWAPAFLHHGSRSPPAGLQRYLLVLQNEAAAPPDMEMCSLTSTSSWSLRHISLETPQARKALDWLVEKDDADTRPFTPWGIFSSYREQPSSASSLPETMKVPQLEVVLYTSRRMIALGWPATTVDGITPTRRLADAVAQGCVQLSNTNDELVGVAPLVSSVSSPRHEYSELQGSRSVPCVLLAGSPCCYASKEAEQHAGRRRPPTLPFMTELKATKLLELEPLALTNGGGDTADDGGNGDVAQIEISARKRCDTLLLQGVREVVQQECQKVASHLAQRMDRLEMLLTRVLEAQESKPK